MKLIVGLGNPGKDYMFTRHNVGFLALDRLAEHNKEQFVFDKKSNAEICKTTLDEKRVILVKPQTFMNNSGTAVRALMDFFKISVKELIVVHDDKDIPLGNTRVQTNRGPAGHNGVRSIIEHVGTQDFTRVRIGVAPKEGEIHDTAHFVLGQFTSEERNALHHIFDNTLNNVRQLIH